MSEATTDGDNGRDAKGQFTQGNPGGPGNPHAKATAAWRKALMDAATPQRVRNVIDNLFEAAEAGLPWAVKEVLDRTLGRPMQGLALVELSQDAEADALPVADAELLRKLRFELMSRREWDPMYLEPVSTGVAGIAPLPPIETPESLKEKQRQRLEALLEVVESWSNGTPSPTPARRESLEVVKHISQPDQ